MNRFNVLHRSLNNGMEWNFDELSFSLVGFVLQVCFLPACHFLLKVLRVQWALDSLAHHWWATAVCSLTVLFFPVLIVEMCHLDHYFCDDFESSFLTGGPPYPPNQYGGGRGNYDNFRGQGGYLGKPRNIRWDHCTCDLYFAMSCLFSASGEFWTSFLNNFYSSFLGLLLFSFSTLNLCRMSRGDPRNIIEYRDLDAPDDMDFF